jgi:hypothetical protein
MHVETNEKIVEQHGVTRIEIIEAIQITEQSGEAAQQATQGGYPAAERPDEAEGRRVEGVLESFPRDAKSEEKYIARAK